MNDQAHACRFYDLAHSVAFALRLGGESAFTRVNVHVAKIAADRIVRHLENAGYGVLKKPPIGGAGDNPGARTPGYCSEETFVTAAAGRGHHLNFR